MLAQAIGHASKKTQLTDKQQNPLRIQRVEIRYKPEADFARISEFFGAKEQSGRYILLRSDAEDRSGMYWIFWINRLSKYLPEGCTCTLEYTTAEHPELRVATFDLPATDTGYIYLGITGKDWDNSPLITWRLSIKDISGTVLTERKSLTF